MLFLCLSSLIVRNVNIPELGWAVLRRPRLRIAREDGRDARLISELKENA